ncbi:MBL fold metallo-hydrolase [Kaistella jeonii]|uniref:Beta-lactamase n=1 Tax=Kaistella jeonii TaxID=266749 RepID=A0A0C1F5E0_9FLAO|nr:MBL fold metallo-hydrolase [Kaistella jeonii]KIA88422.1 beta-lactamase [Kaistella jeonii]SFC16654.1 L-ascorbate metabolism protein UlaG, beta-lactamase superfamily [Kaistella jeonii]VEI95386.1 metal-dependent hydrolase [Kaistella jeonii]
MIILLPIIIAFFAVTILFMQHPKFGKAPSGKRLERILKSPHYKKDKFDNINFTPPLAEDASMPKIMLRFLFGKKKNLSPKHQFNFSKTDLKNLNPDENVYVWMGHSSYYLQIDGKKILVDPVFSGNASPVSFITKAFPGADLYSTDDIPELDYLIITHDHWDHLDYKTVKELNLKVKWVITGLGTGEHLEYWNYDPKKIIELDWGENFDIGNGFKIYAETARHFSGRTFKRNQAIWASFVFETPDKKIYIGGDSGFDDHFEKIGNKYGGFDLAILENGQYNKDWRYIHMMPEEFLIAAKNLKARRIIPVHNSKFVLALHHWEEPMQKISVLNESENLRLITPKIGEKVYWEDDQKLYDKWWNLYQENR